MSERARVTVVVVLTLLSGAGLLSLTGNPKHGELLIILTLLCGATLCYFVAKLLLGMRPKRS